MASTTSVETATLHPLDPLGPGEAIVSVRGRLTT